MVDDSFLQLRRLRQGGTWVLDLMEVNNWMSERNKLDGWNMYLNSIHPIIYENRQGVMAIHVDNFLRGATHTWDWP